MSGRNKLLWSLSALLLAWLIAMTALTDRIVRCREHGGQWSWRGWKCRLLPPVQLHRDIRRS